MKHFYFVLLIFIASNFYSQNEIEELEEVIIKSEVNLDKFLDSFNRMNN